MKYNYKYIDLSYLKEITSNVNFILKMFNIFKSEFPKIEKNMHEAIQEKDYDELGKVAHKAKSSVSVLGMKKEADEMLKLEHNIKYQINNETFDSMAIAFLKNSKEAIKEIEIITEQLKTNPDFLKLIF